MATTTVNRPTMDLSLERCGSELKNILLCKYICAYFNLNKKYCFFKTFNGQIV
jgi:hypothetical protein